MEVNQNANMPPTAENMEEGEKPPILDVLLQNYGVFLQRQELIMLLREEQPKEEVINDIINRIAIESAPSFPENTVFCQITDIYEFFVTITQLNCHPILRAPMDDHDQYYNSEQKPIESKEGAAFVRKRVMFYANDMRKTNLVYVFPFGLKVYGFKKPPEEQ